jgi:hypothetical protein
MPFYRKRDARGRFAGGGGSSNVRRVKPKLTATRLALYGHNTSIMKHTSGRGKQHVKLALKKATGLHAKMSPRQQKKAKGIQGLYTKIRQTKGR